MFYPLHDIPKTHTKFDDSWPSSFGDNNLSNNPDRQVDGNGNTVFRTLGLMTHRENIKVASRPMDSITMLRK